MSLAKSGGGSLPAKMLSNYTRFRVDFKSIIGATDRRWARRATVDMARAYHSWQVMVEGALAAAARLV